MIVYHGGLEIIKKPDVAHSYRRLDFGKGFYVTTVRVQAEKWARRKANISDRDFAIVNQLEFPTSKMTPEAYIIHKIPSFGY